MSKTIVNQPVIASCQNLTPGSTISFVLPQKTDLTHMCVKQLEFCTKEWGMVVTGYIDGNQLSELRVKRNGELSLTIIG
jgi:hypothetical protein